MKLVAVMLGGALGAAARFWLSALPHRYFKGDFPIGTLLVNVIGCLLIGVLFVSAEKNLLPATLQPFLITGFLGALTTFSTFGLDQFILVEKGRGGVAIAYLFVSIGLGLASVFAGATFARSWLSQ